MITTNRVIFILLLVYIVMLLVYYVHDSKRYEETWKPIADKLVQQHQHTMVEYDLYTTWEGYRLGDMVTKYAHRINKEGQAYHFQHFPDSIATAYLKRTNPLQLRCYPVIQQIINEYTTDDLPDANTYIIHLRVGDVLDNDHSPDMVTLLSTREHFYDNLYGSMIFIRYTYPLSYYYEKLKQIKQYPIQRIVLVAGSHIKLTSYHKSSIFIHCIQSFLEKESGCSVSLRLAKNPDEDLIYMSKAAYFTPSGGGYSQLIKDLVLLNKGRII